LCLCAFVVKKQREGFESLLSLKHRLYYPLKPLIPRALQLFLRKRMVLRQRLKHTAIWPIDEKAAEPPKGWQGWPEQKRFAFVLTHDVDSQKGYDKCLALADIDERHGFRSSFNFVAEDYHVSPELRMALTARGFEVGLHGLKHDCYLYWSRKNFSRQAVSINHYLKEWGCVGFRSPAMHRNLEWIHDLEIEYDASTFDTDPFEPMPTGAGSIFPFFVRHPSNTNGYVELPYTLPQDFTVYVLMEERTTDIWKRKLAWIAKHGGMALLLMHPDYINFGGEKPGREEYSSALYEEFLIHVKKNYSGQYWHVLPKDMARFWSANYAAAQ
jgi:peptidoglycan/xylan/chitin deacetylase (PgdA/CDA1 family)